MGTVGDGLNQLGGTNLTCGQEDDSGDACIGGVGSQGSAGVTGAGTGHGFDGAALGHHLFDDTDEDGHAQVLEAAGVAIAAEFDPEVGDAELFAEAIGPKEVGVAFEHADDVFVGEGGDDPFAQAPDAAAVGPDGGTGAGFEEFLPVLGAAGFEGFAIVVDFEEATADRAGVDDVVDGMLAGAACDAAEIGCLLMCIQFRCDC